MNKPHYYLSPDNYTKTLSRLQKSIRSGQFARYTQQKKWQIWNRLCRYARQLGIKIKAPIAAACFAAGLSFASPAVAQTFTMQSGAANPFNGIDVSMNPAPTFVDIDGDGDMDAFVGKTLGIISYYKNTGTAAASVFAIQAGTLNPLDGVDVGYHAAPMFADIDGDGDEDAFIGALDGSIRYYKNTGTVTAPVLTLQTGADDPFDGVDVGDWARPSFVDIDDDGDLDSFIGTSDGAIRYYKNTGTASAAIFTAQAAPANPWNGIFILQAAPAFMDMDNDGDMDVVMGRYSIGLDYYQNTGTATDPVFTAPGGAGNPFSTLYAGYISTPGLVDIDGDGDMDVLVGSSNGDINYYRNNTILLPLRLVNFSGARRTGYNQLQWQTTGDITTRRFELEISSDGRNFSKIAMISATGNSNNNYNIKDNSVHAGKIFYRLKMVNADDRFSYSEVIWIAGEHAVGVSIYPNPVADVLNINIGNARILKTPAGIYDASGRLQRNILINSNQQRINVQALTKGEYVIKFADNTVESFIKK